MDDIIPQGVQNSFADGSVNAGPCKYFEIEEFREKVKEREQEESGWRNDTMKKKNA